MWKTLHTDLDLQTCLARLERGYVEPQEGESLPPPVVGARIEGQSFWLYRKRGGALGASGPLPGANPGSELRGELLETPQGTQVRYFSNRAARAAAGKTPNYALIQIAALLAALGSLVGLYMLFNSPFYWLFVILLPTAFMVSSVARARQRLLASADDEDDLVLFLMDLLEAKEG